MKVCFETFGCRLNKAEALQQEADYVAKGWELTDSHSDADLFVVRGCSVTARAQRDCERLVEHLKRKYPSTPLRIEGCLEKPLAQRLRSGLQAHNVPHSPENVPVRTARAYLKAQDGCSGKCTFCIVPHFRGPSTSVPFSELVDKARRFVDAGYGEIVLTGCNLSLYASEGRRLPNLVEALADIAAEASARIRLGSLEPGACALETVHAMAGRRGVCRFLHVPVQSGSDRMLRAMRRDYTVADVEELAGTAVRLLPNLGLGCDLMTGFPDESELDFRATKGLFKRIPFSNAHVFPYSERPGTLAAGLPGAIDRNVRSQRAHSLAELVSAKRLKFAKRFIGRTVEIVSERDSGCSGWTAEYLYCRSVSPVPRKTLAKIFVTKVHRDATLEGRIAST